MLYASFYNFDNQFSTEIGGVIKNEQIYLKVFKFYNELGRI
jgi:hypothetical protein